MGEGGGRRRGQPPIQEDNRTSETAVQGWDAAKNQGERHRHLLLNPRSTLALVRGAQALHVYGSATVYLHSNPARSAMRRWPTHPLLRLPSPWCCCRVLWSLVPKVLDGILLLWRSIWAALLFYKLCWEVVFRLVQEGTSSVSSWLEETGDADQEDKPFYSTDSPWPWEAGAAKRLEERVQRLQASSNAALGRLSALEVGVRYLSQELRTEKLLWSSRYLELLREQQDLAVQLQRQEQTLWLPDLEGQRGGPQEIPPRRWGLEEEEEEEPAPPTKRGPGPRRAKKERLTP